MVEVVDQATVCDLCGKSLEGRPWMLLNRYGLGTGECRLLTQAYNEDDEYLWELGPGEEPDYITGPVLCWPECLVMWIEGKMVAGTVWNRSQGE